MYATERERGGRREKNKIIEWEEMEEGRGIRRGKRGRRRKGGGKGGGRRGKRGKGRGRTDIKREQKNRDKK